MHPWLWHYQHLIFDSKEKKLMRHPCFMLLGLKIIWHVPNQGVIKCLILDCCQQCLDKVYRHIKTDSKDAFSSINTVVVSTYQVLNSCYLGKLKTKITNHDHLMKKSNGLKPREIFFWALFNQDSFQNCRL